MDRNGFPAGSVKLLKVRKRDIVPIGPATLRDGKPVYSEWRITYRFIYKPDLEKPDASSNSSRTGRI